MELGVAGCWGWMLWDQVTVANLGELLDLKKGQKLAANQKKLASASPLKKGLQQQLSWKTHPHSPKKKCWRLWRGDQKTCGHGDWFVKLLWFSESASNHPTFLRFRPLATTMLSGNRHQIRGCFNGLEDLFKGWCFSMLLQADLSCLKTQHFVLKCFFSKILSLVFWSSFSFCEKSATGFTLLMQY